MSRRGLVQGIVFTGLLVLASNRAMAQWGPHRHYGYYGYGRPIIVPPPVVIAPAPVYAPAPYIAPVAPVPIVPPPPMVVPARPVYVPSYTYGAIGSRGYGFGYNSPGFGIYVGGR